MQINLVNILTYVEILSYKNGVTTHYPIIPTGMRYNIKGRWQVGNLRRVPLESGLQAPASKIVPLTLLGKPPVSACEQQ